nr:reverse transcriptase domain-containing protein [Tanacetum cinerariifolium]
VAKVGTSSSTPAVSSEVAELKDLVRALLLDKKNQSSAPVSSSTPAPPSAYQAPAYQAPIPHTQSVSQTDFESYVKDNDAVLRNMQNQGQNVQNQLANLTDMLSIFMGSNTASSSGRDNERRRDQANEQIEKFYEIFKDMSFEISFTDALILMPKFASTLKALIGNKEKLNEMARTPMNEHSNFVVVDFEPDPRVPLILRRCFLKTGQALIDVHKGELTLRIGNEAITYNLDQPVRYSANYNQMTANKIYVICEEYSQEVLGFFDTTASGHPTPHDDPIISTTSPTLTSFGDSDFLLFEEADAFLGLEDDPNLPKINPFYYYPEW